MAASEPAAEPAGGGLICPRCRHRAPAPPADAVTATPLQVDRAPLSRRSRLQELQRCPADGAALVSLEVLAEADGDPFLGMTIAERFVILGKLGAGSMGTVYRARQEAMGRDVAIKILRSDRAFDTHAKARFTREARAMSLLTSPHTVTVFDFGEIMEESPDAELGIGGPGGSLYLAMELLEGESLGQRLKRLRRLTVADAARFARHALLSLAEAHDKGIIHRDLKPDNLFLAQPPTGEQEEVCKVLDFGIAKVVSDREKVDALETQAGTVFGTPRYMSPEQAQGKPLDARSDLYSLGVLLYQMLVGRPPFVDDDAVVVMARHIKSTPVPAIEAASDAGIPRALSDLLQRVLAKSPEDRPRSANEFIEELERAVDDPSRGDRGGSGGEVGATGELLAVVGEDVDTSQTHASRRAAPRSRAAVVALATAAVSSIVVALVVGGLGPVVARRDAQPYVARAARVRADAAAMHAGQGPPQGAAGPPAQNLGVAAPAPGSGAAPSPDRGAANAEFLAPAPASGAAVAPPTTSAAPRPAPQRKPAPSSQQRSGYEKIE